MSAQNEIGKCPPSNGDMEADPGTLPPIALATSQLLDHDSHTTPIICSSLIAKSFYISNRVRKSLPSQGSLQRCDAQQPPVPINEKEDQALGSQLPINTNRDRGRHCTTNEPSLSDVEETFSCDYEEVSRADALLGVEGAHFNVAAGKTRVANQRKSRKRAKRRLEAQAEEQTELKQVSKKRRLDALEHVVEVRVGEHQHSSQQPVAQIPDRVITKDELLKTFRMRVFSWDGCSSHLILDHTQHIIGVLAGRPRNMAAWDSVHGGALTSLEIVADRLKELSEEAGDSLDIIQDGISIGEQTVQLIEHKSGQVNALAKSLVMSEHIQRLCKFASAAYELFGKQHYRSMKSQVELLRTEKRHLARPFDAKLGVFPTRSFDLGRRSGSVPRLENRHLAHSWCALTALGRFDSRKGGHLVLWDFGLAVELPPGATILFPSAILRHSITPVQHGELRMSIQQYAECGLTSIRSDAAAGGITGDMADGSVEKSSFTHIDDLLKSTPS